MDPTPPSPGISDHRAAFGIDDVNAIFMVQGGHVDLYLSSQGDGSDEHRIHFARMEPGDLVFGFDPATIPFGWAVSLLPSRHAELEMVFEEDIRDRPNAIEAWILRLTEACVPVQEPPVLHPLAPGACVTVGEKLSCISGAHPVVWLLQQQGSGLLFGNEAATVAPHTLFPMARTAWIQEKRGHVLSAHSTEEVMAGPDWWPGIIAFQGVLIKALVSRSQARAQAAALRLSQREQADAQRLDRTLRQVLQPIMGTAKAPPRGASRDPLLRACEAIGQVQSLQFSAAHDGFTHSPAIDP